VLAALAALPGALDAAAEALAHPLQLRPEPARSEADWSIEEARYGG
jgi:hypothetical protein